VLTTVEKLTTTTVSRMKNTRKLLSKKRIPMVSLALLLEPSEKMSASV